MEPAASRTQFLPIPDIILEVISEKTLNFTPQSYLLSDAAEDSVYKEKNCSLPVSGHTQIQPHSLPLSWCSTHFPESWGISPVFQCLHRTAPWRTARQTVHSQFPATNKSSLMQTLLLSFPQTGPLSWFTATSQNLVINREFHQFFNILHRTGLRQ